jgi:hypothetical protein
MSPLLELLLDVSAFVGFLAVATYHRPAKKGDESVGEHREETDEDTQHSRAPQSSRAG